MHFIDWIITICPLVVVLSLAIYSARYVRGVVDYLAAGRVAGRYVISAGDLTSGQSFINPFDIQKLRDFNIFALLGLILQRNWAESVYPWLEAGNWDGSIGVLLETISRPFHPFVVWEMNPVKFPINSYELYFLAMVSGILGVILTFWFLIGGVIDLRRLFVDLAARKDDPLDNGMVEGHVSLVDKAIFEARTGHKQD